MHQRACSSRLKKTVSPDFTSGVNRDNSSRCLCYRDHPGWGSLKLQVLRPKLQVPGPTACPASQKFWKYFLGPDHGLQILVARLKIFTLHTPILQD